MIEEEYIQKQLITYIGNKRKLLRHIDKAINLALSFAGKKQFDTTVDLFAGSGVVSRLLKQHSSKVIANDFEPYSETISKCYLPDLSHELNNIKKHVDELNLLANNGARADNGFFEELYSADPNNVNDGDRAFYTQDNGRRLDFFCQEIHKLDNPEYFLAPLMYRASVNVNTGGVFRGFYKDKNTGIGKFGGTAANGLTRITAPIELEVPIQSRFKLTDYDVYRADSNALARDLEPVDLVYIDPPYNQHSYGANYFMLNLINSFERPTDITPVSGVPVDWQRSGYYRKAESARLIGDLVSNIKARFIVMSFSSDGFVSHDELMKILVGHGFVMSEEINYKIFGASRNYKDRHTDRVKEYVILLDKSL